MENEITSCQQQPCKSCPFKKNTPFIVKSLPINRRKEIIDIHIYQDKYFACHSNYSKLCAGIIMLSDKINKNGNMTTRIGRHIGMIPEEFENMDIIIDTAEEFINPKK